MYVYLHPWFSPTPGVVFLPIYIYIHAHMRVYVHECEARIKISAGGCTIYKKNEMRNYYF